jgi:NADH-quinone oxidoreductase subunit L
VLTAVSTILIIITSIWAWSKFKKYQTESLEEKGFGKVLQNKWYVDELYDTIIVKPLRALSLFFNNVIEKSGIDAVVNGVGRSINYSSRQIRLLQNGQVGAYILMMVFGIVILFIIQLFAK